MNEALTIDDVITLTQAADDLGLAQVTLRAQAAKGVLEARNLPGLGWITTRQEVARYRAQHLGRVGRPAVPHLFATITWPDAAYETKTLLLGEQVDIGTNNREVVRAIATQAIAEGAVWLQEVTSKIDVDPRTRGLLRLNDETVPRVLFGLRSE